MPKRGRKNQRMRWRTKLWVGSVNLKSCRSTVQNQRIRIADQFFRIYTLGNKFGARVGTACLATVGRARIEPLRNETDTYEPLRSFTP